MPLGHPLEINALVRDGALSATLTATFGDAELAEFAARWRDALTEASRLDAGGHTPSDFPLVELDQAEVDELGPDVAGRAARDPAAGGLLLPRPGRRPGADVYVVQQIVELRGEVDAAALRRAAQAVVDRHAPLRATFRQLPDGRIVQVVAGAVDVPWREVDRRRGRRGGARAGGRVRPRAPAAGAVRARAATPDATGSC